MIRAMRKRYPAVCGHREPGLWWFRLFGHGLIVKNHKNRVLLFSERNGLRGKIVGNWFIDVLRP